MVYDVRSPSISVLRMVNGGIETGYLRILFHDWIHVGYGYPRFDHRIFTRIHRVSEL